MPCIYTHYLFAERAIDALPEGIVATPEERRAFLLGANGPDPMLIRHATTLKRSSTARFLARDMHHSHMTRNLMCMREGVEHLGPDDQGIGRCFVLGFLTHWLTDSTCHPFIFAQQNEICAADETLAKNPSAVHAALESDLGAWQLWTTRRVTVVQFPVSRMTARTIQIDRVMGALVAYAAQDVFGTTIPSLEYAYAYRDFDRAYRLIDPVGSPSSTILSRIERLGRANSQVLGQGHPIWTSDGCAAANLDHRRWENEASGISSTQSFPELLDAALDRWPGLAEAFIRGDEDALRAEIAGRNYSGIVVEDV